jgi:hypothetical protein
MEVSLTSIFVDKFKALTGSFYEKKCMIEKGEIESAISQKPSGVWYSNDYALALKELGDTPVVLNVKGDLVPASMLYTRMKTNHFFYTFMANQTFWEVPTCRSTFLNKKINVLEMKRGVRPSDAYEKLASGLSFIDCASIIDLALGLALIEKYGKSRFDEFMSRNDTIKFSHTESPFREKFFVKEAAPRPSSPDLKFSASFRVGSMYFVSNHPDYISKHPHGTSKGMNLVCVGFDESEQPLFTGLGLNPEGVSLSEVALTLVRDFNEAPVDESLLLTHEAIKLFHASEDRIEFALDEGSRYCLSFDQVKKMASGEVKSHFSDSVLAELDEEVESRKFRRSYLAEAKITIDDLLSSEGGFLSNSKFRASISEDYIDSLFRA